LAVSLHCFGLTYGVGHVRQDSSVHRRVWTNLFEALRKVPELSSLAILKNLRLPNLNGRSNLKLHEKLNAGDAESKKIFAFIARLFNARSNEKGNKRVRRRKNFF